MKKNRKIVIPQTHPENAEPGKGAPGNHIGVQMAQTTAVNPPDMVIPIGTDREANLRLIHEMEDREAKTGMSTTDGYIIDESGHWDNYAVEPEMYVEK